MIKKKENLEIDIGFDEQIWCNFSRDKNLTKRHAIQGSMKNTRFSGDMEKGVRVSFSRVQMNSPPSLHESDLTAFFLLGLKKKNRSKTWKLIQFWFFTNIASIWDFCGFNNILGFGTVFFLPPIEEKNRSNQCSLPLSRVDRKKCTLPQTKKTIPLWYNRGIFHQIWIWVEQPSLGLIQKKSHQKPSSVLLVFQHN